MPVLNESKACEFFEMAIAHCKPEVNPSDYTKDGILYCGKCNTPKECIQVHFGKEYRLPIMCRCKADEVQREKKEKRIAELERRRKIAMPCPAYRDMTFENSDEKLTIAENYVANWNDMMRDNVGLLFFGNPGSGKTYMAASIANALLMKGVPVYMDNMAQLISMMGDNYDGGRDKCLYKIGKCDLLVIDDFGIERSTDFALQCAYDLIDARIRTEKPMIVTTNLDIAALKNPPDMRFSRIYSRLASIHPVAVQGDDKRKQQTNERFKAINRLLKGDGNGK